MDRNKMLEGINIRRALFGLFFVFDNRLQTAGDAFYDEITCKQFFLLISLSLFKEITPTINELSEIMGSSHQNVKQIVNKLEAGGYVNTYSDEHDKRKLRVVATEKVANLGEKYRAKELEFFERFYDGISDSEVEAAYKIISKIEKNLIAIREEHR
ncbi:MAG: MarR family transcriptional regulator [Clostridiaceae bacterium]|nr:MarR family transcriptional regulator [Clostridiaceae bacterium]